MLPKQHRLKLNEEKYDRLRKRGKSFDTATLQIVVRKTEQNQPAKFVFLVPKKLDKRSTKRNRTRRLLSTAVHKLLLQVKDGHEVMVVGRKIFKDEKLQEVLPDVEKALQKAGLFNM